MVRPPPDDFSHATFEVSRARSSSGRYQYLGKIYDSRNLPMHVPMPCKWSAAGFPGFVGNGKMTISHATFEWAVAMPAVHRGDINNFGKFMNPVTFHACPDGMQWSEAGFPGFVGNGKMTIK
ncbi:hypothetical protein CEXT_242521 [Caerostris extrusa]|uniref:Uncharacterized protein n=1 Tax=Caerostris extrusa TaxID=172846 RepID=A0AAV4WT82_CAEEX|nr:hypothetical protein CEXT_242521 [Caerostris extrusa]